MVVRKFIRYVANILLCRECSLDPSANQRRFDGQIIERNAGLAVVYPMQHWDSICFLYNSLSFLHNQLPSPLVTSKEFANATLKRQFFFMIFYMSTCQLKYFVCHVLF